MEDLSWEEDPQDVINASRQAYRLASDNAERFNISLELQGRAERLNIILVIEEGGVNHRPGQHQGSGRTFSGLGLITLPMSSRVGVEQLSIARDEYCSLMKSKLKAQKGNMLQKASVSDLPAQITNLFFNDLIGPEALKRVANIIRHYNRPDNGAARRADNLSCGDIPLKEVRNFFHTYSRAQRAQNGTGSVFFQNATQRLETRLVAVLQTTSTDGNG